jgi:hypothetical protein
LAPSPCAFPSVKEQAYRTEGALAATTQGPREGDHDLRKSFELSARVFMVSESSEMPGVRAAETSPTDRVPSSDGRPSAHSQNGSIKDGMVERQSPTDRAAMFDFRPGGYVPNGSIKEGMGGGSVLTVPDGRERAMSSRSRKSTSSVIPHSAPLVRPGTLAQRHTLEVPKVSARSSGEGREDMDGVVTASGRFSPNTPTRRRGSLQLTRRSTRHSHSDGAVDHVPQDEDAARWAEHVKVKRAERRVATDDEDRVIIGKRVEPGSQNYTLMYNMLTGIRFTVSRVHAKPNRELTETDWTESHKYNFDITGSELTPSVKYDFKFKDYAPWVFREIRSIFNINPVRDMIGRILPAV